MNNLQTFINNDFGSVRTLTLQDGAWFVGKDVAEILGYSNTNKAIQMHVDNDDKFLRSQRGNELGKLFITLKDMTEYLGRQDNWFINESGVYSLILSSKLPNAKKFKRWITHEVLPSIRRNGAYMTDKVLEKTLEDPDYLIGLLKRMKEEKAKRLEAEKQIEADRPKVIFANAVATSKTSILVGDLAKILRGNGVNIGQQRLFQWLRDNGYLIRKKGASYNMPTQYSMELGLFKIKEGSYINGDGVNVITKTPKVTGKGQQYFINRLVGGAGA